MTHRQVTLPKHLLVRYKIANPPAPLPDGGFESGGFGTWYQCGNVNASITTAKAHSGTYSEFSGSTAAPEINGDAGVCQDLTVPTRGTLSFWVYQGTNETGTNYAWQEADLLDSSGYVIDNFYYSAANTNGWQLQSVDLSAYAGQSVSLYFGVHGNGWNRGYIYQYVDDVSFLGSGPTPTPVPTTTPRPTPTPVPTSTPRPTPTPVLTPTPTPKPTSTPTPVPTATPTPVPTATPGSWPCNDAQFLSDQSAKAAGQLPGYTEEDVCGLVTQVLPAKTTASGRHGYFYVAMPSGYQIEIYSNLDAMAQAPTNKPPSTWPWVSVNQYAYVQGRYFYDSNGTQGIDWTEDDTGSWPTVGWVVVCTTATTGCNKYW